MAAVTRPNIQRATKDIPNECLFVRTPINLLIPHVINAINGRKNNNIKVIHANIFSSGLSKINPFNGASAIPPNNNPTNMENRTIAAIANAKINTALNNTLITFPNPELADEVDFLTEVDAVSISLFTVFTMELRFTFSPRISSFSDEVLATGTAIH